MPEVLILAGVSGSGKSTFAVQWCEENPPALRINKDSIRQSILPHSLRNYWRTTDKSYIRRVESLVESLQTQQIQAALSRDWNIVIDNTHTKLSCINQLLRTLQAYPVRVRFKLIDTPVEECVVRDSRREASVGEAVIRQQATNLAQTRKMFDFQQVFTFLPQNSAKGLCQQAETLPPCVLVDIDGTVAEMNSRFPFDWEKVQTDQPKMPIIRLVKALKAASYGIIFFSGRDAVCRNQTLSWLCEHFSWQPTDFELFMRPHKDCRKDSVVKKEMFDQYIRGKYFVDFVIEIGRAHV